MKDEVLIRFANFYEDTKMTLQERTKQAAHGTLFEGHYPEIQTEQNAIAQNLEWMISTASDPEAIASARRVLDANAGIQQKLSWS